MSVSDLVADERSSTDPMATAVGSSHPRDERRLVIPSPYRPASGLSAVRALRKIDNIDNVDNS